MFLSIKNVFLIILRYFSSFQKNRADIFFYLYLNCSVKRWLTWYQHWVFGGHNNPNAQTDKAETGKMKKREREKRWVVLKGGRCRSGYPPAEGRVEHSQRDSSQENYIIFSLQGRTGTTEEEEEEERIKTIKRRRGGGGVERQSGRGSFKRKQTPRTSRSHVCKQQHAGRSRKVVSRR